MTSGQPGSSDPLTPAAIGTRWVLRVRLPDGSATDLVGWLDEVAVDTVTLTEVGLRRHTVPRAAVIAARQAPPAAGGPHPRRTDPETLQQIALPGWLAWHEPLGEWTLRSGAGFTGRANSCLAVGDPGVPVATAAARIVAYADAHGIPPLAQVITGSEPDRALQELGWTETYVATDVYAVRLADLLTARPPDPRVGVSETLDEAWWEAYGRSRPNDCDPAVLRMILDGQPPRAFAAAPGPDADSPLIAIGRGHLHRDWLGIASIWTEPGHRRRGLGTAVLIALGHWAARRGARYGYLQVAAANSAAIEAYARLGFTRHHGYRYLSPAAATAP